jgi:alkyl sulfatase BDS1-like metallo-beta-lactamase superfamily hydrolase
VVNKAQNYFAAGDYRWVAEVLNHVVMADPEHIAGRALLADTYEQLGYQSESAPWRNFYLCGALELREGLPETRNYAASAGMAAGIPIENIFQVMAVRLLPEEAAAQDLQLLLCFGDLGQDYVLQIKNAVLHYFVAEPENVADAQLSLTSTHFKQMIMGQVSAAELIEQQYLQIDGDVNALLRLGSLFDQFPRRYPLVTPRDQ